jgi:hypothetical protein
VQDAEYKALPDASYNAQGELDPECKLYHQSAEAYKGVAAVMDGNHRADISEPSPVLIAVC